MKAILLAAGEGQRLKGVLDDIPKPMARIAGKPILEYNIEWLKNADVTDIYVNLHHLPDVITQHFGDGSRWGTKITYSFEPQLLGTAGAVKKIADTYWKNSNTESFLVVYGDNLFSNFELHRIIHFHKEKRGIGTICLYRKPEEIFKSGIAVINENCRIINFIEKPSANQVASDLVNTGVYVFEPAILKYIQQNSYFDFSRDVFAKVIAGDELLYGFLLNANIVTIDTPQLFKKFVIAGDSM